MSLDCVSTCDGVGGGMGNLGGGDWRDGPVPIIKLNLFILLTLRSSLQGMFGCLCCDVYVSLPHSNYYVASRGAYGGMGLIPILLCPLSCFAGAIL